MSIKNYHDYSDNFGSDYFTLEMGKKKTVLSLYSSKIRRKREKKDTTKRIGRPRVLHFPKPTKDLDSTLPYEDEEEEQAMSDETYCSDAEDEQAMSYESNISSSQDSASFQFQYTNRGSDCQRLENMAGQSSSSSSSSSPSSSPPSSSSESESNSDDDDDVLGRPYIRYCCHELRNVDFVRNLVKKLYRARCLQDFMLLVTQLANGKLSPLNIAFLLCLERAKWQSLKSTTQMKYRDVTKSFWLVVYRLLKGKGLRFFSGPKNYGQVVSNDTTKGKYDPSKSEINFVVPDERYLRSQDKILGRLIPPGIIQDSLNIVENHKDVVLMADCKRLAKGLKSDRMGDVDLWGHEKPPTLQEKLDKYRAECDHVKDSIQSLPNWPIVYCHDDLKYVLQLITTKIRDVREIENIERKHLLNYEKCNPEPNVKASAKGACRSHIYDCKVFINNALELNQHICKVMSYLQRTSCMFNSTRVRLQYQRNCRRLLAPTYVAQHTTVVQHPEWFRQHSRQWKQLRAQAHITGSTAYNAMGFRGFSHVHDHFREFIYKKTPPPVDAQTQARMQHGTDNEVSHYQTCICCQTNGNVLCHC